MAISIKKNSGNWLHDPQTWNCEDGFCYEIPADIKYVDLIDKVIERGFVPGTDFHAFTVIYADDYTSYRNLRMGVGAPEHRRIYFRTEELLILFRLSIAV